MKGSAAESEDGMRFLLLSRVILGKSEVVPRGSSQSCPSSPEFDSGVDNLSSPKKYIVWSTHMNTHVLPEFLVCLKTPFNFNSPRRLRSPWMPFPLLIKALSKFLPPPQIFIIQKHYRDQQVSVLFLSSSIFASFSYNFHTFLILASFVFNNNNRT